jgi:hypothetical protein
VESFSLVRRCGRPNGTWGLENEKFLLTLKPSGQCASHQFSTKSDGFCPRTIFVCSTCFSRLSVNLRTQPSPFGLCNARKRSSVWRMDWILVYGVAQKSLECRDVAQVVSRLLFHIFEARVQCQVKPCEIYCVEIGTGTGLFTEHFDLPLSPLLHSHLHIHVALTRKTNGEECQASKKQCSRENYLGWYKKYFHFF